MQDLYGTDPTQENWPLIEIMQDGTSPTRQHELNRRRLEVNMCPERSTISPETSCLQAACDATSCLQAACDALIARASYGVSSFFIAATYQ